MAEESILSKLVSLREEDFLTAVFACLLDRDRKFRIDYLRALGVKNIHGLKVAIQRSYGENNEDRPDLEMRGHNTLIFQENKIQSTEERNQLKRYASRLKKAPEKNKRLVYMSKYLAEPRLREEKYGVPVKFMRWDEVGRILSAKISAHDRNKWLRTELLSFLKEREMIQPPALNLTKLNHHWRVFEPQRKSLGRMIEETEARIEDDLGSSGYRCRVREEGLALYVSRTKGKLARLMGSQYIWIVSGVEFIDDDESFYAYSGIGWVRSYSERISSQARRLLESKSFKRDDGQYDGYYVEKDLRRIIGKSKDFQAQCEAFSKWIIAGTRISQRAIAIIEREW